MVRQASHSDGFDTIIRANRTLLLGLLWGALFAAAGLVHGYAFGESIFGAEATPLAASTVTVSKGSVGRSPISNSIDGPVDKISKVAPRRSLDGGVAKAGIALSTAIHTVRAARHETSRRTAGHRHIAARFSFMPSILRDRRSH